MVISLRVSPFLILSFIERELPLLSEEHSWPHCGGDASSPQEPRCVLGSPGPPAVPGSPAVPGHQLLG